MKQLKLTDPETKYAIPPEGCYSYLIPGKKYEIGKMDLGPINGFEIISEEGRIYCLEKECLHINCKDWIFSS